MQEFGSSMPFYGSQVVMNGFGYMRPFNGGHFLIPSMYGTCTSLSYAYAKATDVAPIWDVIASSTIASG
jgi:hypothetical protein